MQKLSTLVVYSSFVMLSQHQSIWYTMEKTFFRKKTTTFKLGLRTVGLFTKNRIRKCKIENVLKNWLQLSMIWGIVNWSWLLIHITSKSIIWRLCLIFQHEKFIVSLQLTLGSLTKKAEEILKCFQMLCILEKSTKLIVIQMHLLRTAHEEVFQK